MLTYRSHLRIGLDRGIAIDDDEDKEQERLAKRFAKRARMHRLLEVHGEEEEFSRSRLIDEDETIRQELISMKVGQVTNTWKLEMLPGLLILLHETEWTRKKAKCVYVFILS